MPFKDKLHEFLTEWNDSSDYVLVRTSGSTGVPKIIKAEKSRMKASARMTCDFLCLKPGDTALLCMSLDYIAGKMVVVRSIIRNLNLICVEPSGHPLKDLSTAPVFAAMVPIQVINSIQEPQEREILRRIRNLIIGGGAIDEQLAAELKDFPNAVWSTYGMTETLSHIAMRRMSGRESDEWYTPLNGVSISLDKDSCLIIDAPLVCSERLVTNDIVEIAPDGYRFRVIGRKDNVIDSGGIKIQMEEVEDKLNGYLNAPFMITKKSDHKFGEIVVLVVQSQDIENIREICECVLPKYWQPRQYISVDKIPMTETGKKLRKISDFSQFKK
ncbi:MAG: AMP-binding protein [Prevotella sp.]|nr:AMP-binding protein [Prevotella sp.]